MKQSLMRECILQNALILPRGHAPNGIAPRLRGVVLCGLCIVLKGNNSRRTNRCDKRLRETAPYVKKMRAVESPSCVIGADVLCAAQARPDTRLRSDYRT